MHPRNRGTKRKHAAKDQYIQRRRQPEHETSQDPEDRKRSLCEEISAFVIGSLANRKPKLSAMSMDMQSLRRAARTIPQVIGPFIPIEPAFIQGLELESPPNLPARQLSEEEQVRHKIYRKILTAVPGLDEQVRFTIEYDPLGLGELASFLEHAGNEGHARDLATLRKHAYRYIPSVEDYPDTSPFNNFVIARLLFPRHMREDFDLDNERYCHHVQSGFLGITHDDWPTFLYPEAGYDPDKDERGLLRGPLLVACYQLIFDKPRRCEIEISPEKIAYIAVLCHQFLNGAESFSCREDIFDPKAFYLNIMDLFDDEGWAGGTLCWWIKEISGQCSIRQTTQAGAD